MKIGIEIKCCPLCGGRIVVSNLYQYSLNYTMRKDGKIGKRHILKFSCDFYKPVPKHHGTGQILTDKNR